LRREWIEILMWCGAVYGNESEDEGEYLLGCGGVHENGQGSAIDIARRNWVRQISESDVGMLDMVFRRSLVSSANHKLSHGRTKPTWDNVGTKVVSVLQARGKTYSFGFWDLLSGAKYFGTLQGHS